MAMLPNTELPTGGEMSPQERKADLQNDFQKLNSLKGELADNREQTATQMQAGKQDVINEVFQMMLNEGIDPAQPEQVAAFLEKLSQEDPDLLELFMTAFAKLTGEQVPGSPSGAPGGLESGLPGAPAAPGGMPGGMPPMPGGMPPMPGGAPGGMPPMGAARPPMPGGAPGGAMPPRPGAGAGPEQNPMKRFNNLGKGPAGPMM